MQDELQLVDLAECREGNLCRVEVAVRQGHRAEGGPDARILDEATEADGVLPPPSPDALVQEGGVGVPGRRRVDERAVAALDNEAVPDEAREDGECAKGEGCGGRRAPTSPASRRRRGVRRVRPRARAAGPVRVGAPCDGTVPPDTREDGEVAVDEVGLRVEPDGEAAVDDGRENVRLPVAGPQDRVRHRRELQRGGTDDGGEEEVVGRVDERELAVGHAPERRLGEGEVRDGGGVGVGRAQGPAVADVEAPDGCEGEEGGEGRGGEGEG